MFSKLSCGSIVLLFAIHVHGHALISPDINGGTARNDVTRPTKQSPCGAGVDVASLINTAQAVPVANGVVNANITNFDGGVDGSRFVTAQVDPTGTGNNFQAATVTTNGDKNPTDVGTQPLVVQLPAGMTASGGTAGNKMLLAFKSLGGFGNCVVATTDNASAASNNSTTTTTGDVTAACSNCTITSANSTATGNTTTTGDITAASSNCTITSANSTATGNTTTTGNVTAACSNCTITCANSTATGNTTTTGNVTAASSNSTTTCANSTATDTTDIGAPSSTTVATPVDGATGAGNEVVTGTTKGAKTGKGKGKGKGKKAKGANAAAAANNVRRHRQMQKLKLRNAVYNSLDSETE